jgi:hypothetical protein
VIAVQKNVLSTCVLIADAAVCFMIWRSLPGTHLSNGILCAWVVTSVLSACVLSFASQLSVPKIILGVIAAAGAANIANIIIGLSQDPTSHALFPFELAMTAVLSGAGAVVGVVLAVVVRRVSSKS